MKQLTLMGYPNITPWYLEMGLRQRRAAIPALSVVDHCEGPSMS
ncbi:hypothetical protein [Thermosynechococcus sp. HN-54]|nr:hypothetical protein [Thermosynechococcus sp. HN-54]